MPSAATADPDDAGDTPEARTMSMTENAARRVERVVMRCPFGSPVLERGNRGQSAGYAENERITDDRQA
jgi:hypothetical protein